MDIIAIIGLGYVGLPLAVEFSKFYKTYGFDINSKRINELKDGFDRTEEVSSSSLKQKNLLYTANENDIRDANIFIVTVPTPVTKNNEPDLSLIKDASKFVAKLLKKNDIVIYESTVYPGLTEEICVPILEKFSNLSFNKDFFCGYSPERINPGDKKHRLSVIKKITSGSSPKAALKIDNLYKKIIKAGTFLAKDIRTAEAAKVIENTQRDLNIALINELAMIFSKMDLDTESVLEAAGTKWNFLNFKPGLVGGHCIGVDPYYLTYKSKKIGFKPKLILSGRAINDSMANFIVNRVENGLKELNYKNFKKTKILIMGFTFKENCPDVRNTKIIDIYNNLEDLGADVKVYDPVADIEEAKNSYGLTVYNNLRDSWKFHSIIIAVAHDKFKKFNNKNFFKKYTYEKNFIFDVKSSFNLKLVDERL